MTAAVLPVCRPLLPGADAVARYIRQSDAARHYTNRGPMVNLLEQRLARLLGQPDHTVRTTSSGTSALEVAILATVGPAKPDRPLAMLPSFTFAATALAVERCGYQPCFVDVSPQTWALEPTDLARHPEFDRVGVVLSVAPYGRIPDMRALEAFQQATGRQVIIDAAAAFEELIDHPEVLSETIPLTISFHATKTYSTGEGGGVFWRNAAGQDKVVQVSNFGFNLSREARIAGTNAKMSDYHAAVGLAMLDGFAERRLDYARVAGLYRDMAQGRDLPGRLYLPPQVSSAYVLYETPDAESFARTQAHLHSRSIETRRWYEGGLHVQPYFSAPQTQPMPNTVDLSARLLGLPMSPDLSKAEVARVVDALQEAAG